LFHADVVQLHRLRPAFGFSITERRNGVLPDGSPCTYPADFQPVPHGEGEAIMEGGRLFAYRPKAGLVFYQEFHPFKGVRSIDGIDRLIFPQWRTMSLPIFPPSPATCGKARIAPSWALLAAM
jgi:hypothetical protein